MVINYHKSIIKYFPLCTGSFAPWSLESSVIIGKSQAITSPAFKLGLQGTCNFNFWLNNIFKKLLPKN